MSIKHILDDIKEEVPNVSNPVIREAFHRFLVIPEENKTNRICYLIFRLRNELRLLNECERLELTNFIKTELEGKLNNG